ncbi:hypothetical protein HDU76_007958, partial [Blyttiomyces sp. JEL0837]
MAAVGSDAANARNRLTSPVQTLNMDATLDLPNACIVGESAEAVQCGFNTNDQALAYCQASSLQDFCCANVQGFQGPVVTPTPVANGGTNPNGNTGNNGNNGGGTNTVTDPNASGINQSPAATTTGKAAASNNNMFIFIGAGAGGAVLIAGIVIAIVVVRRRRQRNGQAAKRDDDTDGAFRQPANDGMVEKYYEKNLKYGSRRRSANNGGFGNQGRYQQNGNYNDSKQQYGYQPQTPLQQQPPLKTNLKAGTAGYNNNNMGAPSPMSAPAPVAKGFNDYNASLPQIPQQQPMSPAFGNMGGFMPETPVQVAETHEVVYNYIPQLSDELALYVGDMVIVKHQFDDGWGFGFSMTSKTEGSFPLACLAGFAEQDPEAFDNSQYPNDDSTFYNANGTQYDMTFDRGTVRPVSEVGGGPKYKAKKRMSSIYGPGGFGSVNQGASGGKQGQQPKQQKQSQLKNEIRYDGNGYPENGLNSAATQMASEYYPTLNGKSGGANGNAAGGGGNTDSQYYAETDYGRGGGNGTESYYNNGTEYNYDGQ